MYGNSWFIRKTPWAPSLAARSALRVACSSERTCITGRTAGPVVLKSLWKEAFSMFCVDVAKGQVYAWLKVIICKNIKKAAGYSST